MGAPRTVRAVKIPHPLGSPERTPESEKALRGRLLEKALFALQQEVTEPTLFELNEALV